MPLLDRFRREPVGDDDRWLVFGLGNPHHEYGETRHNIGAAAVRRLAETLHASFKPHKSGALVADTFLRPGASPVTLALPTGYMNNSGGPVQQAMRFYKVPHERVVVCHDDLDLELGVIRLKQGGGTAGHNGLKDIERRTGSRDFFRVRIGIGRPPGRQPVKSYVLQRFGSGERDEAGIAAERAADAVVDLVDLGLETAQNRHHAR